MLHQNFILLMFASVFKAKYLTNISPSQKDQLYFEMEPPLQFTLYLPLLGGVYFGQIFCFKHPSTNQQNEILVQNYSSCLISISLLYETFMKVHFHNTPASKKGGRIAYQCFEPDMRFRSRFVVRPRKRNSNNKKKRQSIFVFLVNVSRVPGVSPAVIVERWK